MNKTIYVAIVYYGDYPEDDTTSVIYAGFSFAAAKNRILKFIVPLSESQSSLSGWVDHWKDGECKKTTTVIEGN